MFCRGVETNLTPCFLMTPLLSHNQPRCTITVQWSDNISRFFLIKTPRAFAPTVRAALSFWTSLPGEKAPVPVTLSVVGEHGSLRTAKRSVITKLHQSYKYHLQKMEFAGAMVAGSGDKEREQLAVGQSLQKSLQDLNSIDF